MAGVAGPCRANDPLARPGIFLIFDARHPAPGAGPAVSLARTMLLRLWPKPGHWRNEIMRQLLRTGLFVAIAMGMACAASDPGITTAVKSKLAAADTVKAYQIDVDTQGGVVTLTGTVPSAAACDRALELARGTDGVTRVEDRLTVNAAGTVDDRARKQASDGGAEDRSRQHRARHDRRRPRRQQPESRLVESGAPADTAERIRLRSACTIRARSLHWIPPFFSASSTVRPRHLCRSRPAQIE